MKNNENKREYADIIEAIIGGAEACNLAGHDAQIVTGSAALAKVLVQGFCEANADNVEVVFTDEACMDEFAPEAELVEE